MASWVDRGNERGEKGVGSLPGFQLGGMGGNASSVDTEDPGGKQGLEGC